MNFSVAIKGRIEHLTGATLAGKWKKVLFSSFFLFKNLCSNIAHKTLPTPNDGSTTPGKNLSSNVVF